MDRRFCVMAACALCALGALSTSCDDGKREIRGNLRQMQGAVVTLPSEMLMIRDGVLAFASPDSASHQLVFYYDSSECTSCRVSHHKDLEGLFTLEGSHPGFKVKVIFSPRDEELEALIAEIKGKGLPHPVYVDHTGAFGELNGFLPKDDAYHTFLLDGDGKVSVIGNPLASDRLLELLMEKLDE